MSKSRLVKEFFEYLKGNKKMFLIPILILIALIAVAIIVSQSSALAPFIYSLF